MKKLFKTPEEAIEAWNTWRGRYAEVDLDTFCKNNPCNAGGSLIDEEGNYAPLPVNDMISGIEILMDGTFTVPWPRLTPAQRTAAMRTICRNDAVEFAFSLCARWCALFPSVIEYRDSIAKLLLANDRENLTLNAQLEKWNEYLAPHGFTPFEKNDLRGINLSGLKLGGPPYSGINLRNIDLSFSEMSVCQMNGVNLYGSRLNGTNFSFGRLAFSICASADLSHCCLSNTNFDGADLGYALIKNSLCHKASFQGAVLSHAEFSKSQCTEINLKPLSYKENGKDKRRYTEISGITYTDTRFIGTSTEEIDWTKNPKLRSFIDDQNSVFQGDNKGLWNKIVQAAELKPGWLGFRIDLKKLFK